MVLILVMGVALVSCGTDQASSAPAGSNASAPISAEEPADLGTESTPAESATAAEAPSDSPDTSDTAPDTSDTAADTSDTAAESAEIEETIASAPEPTPQDLVGRWAHYDVVAYEDGIFKTLIISHGFNDFTIVDGEVIDSVEFCFSEQRTDQPITTSMSDEATQAIRPPATPVTVKVVDGVLTISRPATPTPVGVRLQDPATDRLPTDPNDPRIVDDDGDGKPGVTVRVEVSEELSGEIYIARREVFAYEVALIEPDLLQGTVTDDSEQLIIGASDPIFATSGGNWSQFRDPERNPILLRRVGADWDCTRLRAERDQLFPPTPEADW